MELSLVYFTYLLFTLLSGADQTELNTNSCPTSRRLLLFGGFKFPFGEKKPEHVSSSSKSSSSSSSSSSSPAKYARSDNPHGLTIYIRPQTSNELGHKVRSYSHLLKAKLYTKEERAKLKQLQVEKKKVRPSTSNKKKNATQHATKTRDLVAVNDHERDRCRALLRIDHQNSLVPTKTTKQTKKSKKEKSSLPAKVKKVAGQAKKKVTDAAKKALPTNNKQKSIKIKPAKNNAKAVPTEKKKTSDTQPTTPSSSVKETPTKTQTSAPPPPPTPSQSTPNTKSKREKSPPPPPPMPPVNDDSTEPLDINESDLLDNDEKNNSVVGRAYHFVKNMFQLSDDILENNHTDEEDRIVSSPDDQPHRQSRKLLSIEDDMMDYEFNLVSNELDYPHAIEPSDHLSSSFASISKRELLSVKADKRSAPSKTTNSKEKKASSDANKPKVGWAYRYRISRYLAAQKTKRSGRSNKATTGGGKSKQQQTQKKTTSPSNTKGSKRKLLEVNSDDDSSFDEDNQTSDEDIIHTVSITQDFVPKRQLLAAKKAQKIVEEVQDEEKDDDADKVNERRRIKSYEELTDPVEIVRSYDRGLFKPRVGWQFRYRVSRYIDSLRDNIREDQERLKRGLQAIKRKTPQELSGRRKRVLDKPFTPEPEETPAAVDENKPNVGWRYRYRVSKMLEAKRRGDYIDDDEEKRKARLEQKRKPQGAARPVDENEDECIQWEFDIDPELRKISEEGKRVGWAYRYRIRRKLDELKQRQADTGVPFDMETLGGKREKKATTTPTSTMVTSAEKATEVEKKAVGWQYRYRISKMREAQKHESVEASGRSTSKKAEYVPPHEKLDPALARLKPEERVVGWQYRYRIRRKVDALSNGTRDTEGGKRHKKTKQVSEPRTSSKRQEKEKIIKKVEESIEKILNIDDIDETPFMEYFRRSSSYVLFGLIPTARKSVCLLPLPVTFSFCKEQDDGDKIVTGRSSKTETSKQSTTKKLRTKKEKGAKQLIHSRSTKLDTTDEKIDAPIKPLSKPPTTTTDKAPKKQSSQKLRSPVRHDNNEQVRHFDEEEQPVKKIIGVESKKKNNKKRFQIIGKEVKAKQKHSHTTDSPPVPTPTSSPPPVVSTNPPPVFTTTRAPATTTTSPPPLPVQTPTTTRPPPPLPVQTSTTTRPPPPPVVKIPTTTRPPAPPEPPIVSTTTPAPLRSTAEIVQEEAATLLSTQATASEEAVEEVNEANEDLQTTTITPPPSLPDTSDSTTSDEEESDSDLSDGETNSSGSESDSNEENNENFDPLAVKKMKQLYENAKESMHGVFDLKDEKDSS